MKILFEVVRGWGGRGGLQTEPWVVEFGSGSRAVFLGRRVDLSRTGMAHALVEIVAMAVRLRLPPFASPRLLLSAM